MNIHELQEQKNKLATEIRALADRQADWTAEDRASWDALNSDYDAATAAITEERSKLEASEAVQKRLAEIEAETRQNLGDRRIGVDAGDRRAFDPQRQHDVASRADLRALAVQGWLRAGESKPLTSEQRDACRRLGVNANGTELVLRSALDYGRPGWTCQGRQIPREIRAGLDVATSGAGLETIPEGFMYELERRTLEFAHTRQVCRVIKTASGNAMPWPTVNDTSNTGALLAEATTISTSVDPTFAAVTFNAYKYSSKPILISQELLEDSAFNMATEIAGLLGERLGRIEGSQTTTGSGSSQPNGIVTAAGTGVTSASATAITADEILGLVHSVDPSYRMGSSVGFMMNDSVLLYIRKLKLADGQYLWQPGFQMGAPDMLLGYPVTINQAMTGTSSGLPVTATKHVLFGDFSKYVIRDVAEVRFYRLDERYRDLDQTAFVAFKRLDGDAIQAAALKVLLQA